MTTERWCARCGTQQQGRFCPICGERLVQAGPGSNWIVGGMAFAVATVFLLAPLIRPGVEGGAPGVPASLGVVTEHAPPSAARKAADHLFDRVVSAAAADDSVQMAIFLPMAILAYQQARPLDADGLFHLSTLQRTSDLIDEAVVTAGEALAASPNHLLALYAAAQAAEEVGDQEGARRYYVRIIDAWDTQMGTEAPEYRAHAEMLASVRARAERFVESG